MAGGENGDIERKAPINATIITTAFTIGAVNICILIIIWYYILREKLNYITFVSLMRKTIRLWRNIKEKKKGRGENLFKRDERKGNRLPQKWHKSYVV